MELARKPKTNNSLEIKRTEFHVTQGIYFVRKIKNVKASDRAAAMPVVASSLHDHPRRLSRHFRISPLCAWQTQ
jgi:hypothetical protein